MKLCPMTRADVPAFAPVFREIVDAGETYAYPEDLPDNAIADLWMEGAPGARSWRSTTTAPSSAQRRWGRIGPVAAPTSGRRASWCPRLREAGRRAGTGQGHDRLAPTPRVCGDPVQRRRRDQYGRSTALADLGFRILGPCRGVSVGHARTGRSPRHVPRPLLPTARADGTSVLPYGGSHVPELEIVSFPTRADLWAWLDVHAAHHLGVWVQLAKAGSSAPSVTFHDLLEAGIAHGWSESTRRAHDDGSYLQKFTPRRTRERPRSAMSRSPPDWAEASGRMTPAGRAALGLPALPVEVRTSAAGE